MAKSKPLFLSRCRQRPLITAIDIVLALAVTCIPVSSQSVPTSTPSNHWSFRPVVRPEIPDPRVVQVEGVNPLDLFISQRLLEQHLTLSPEASRPTLIRRLYWVMLGLPPEPSEVEAFVQDSEPKAFERLVDRVLADSRYGERWARHWLDVVRFAESNGFETNRERPNAWRFRDYVIAALNQDLPFDQFIQEQIAGDALGRDVATGFLVAGPVDIVGSPDPVLTSQQRADQLDDMVATTGTAFLGLTLGCARCHDHKFDPISQVEYYSMAAVFAGVRHGERALPLPAAREAQVQALDRRIQEKESQLARFTTPPISTPAPAAKRAPVTARENIESFAPVEARWVRFTIRASTGGEPCIDELEVWAGDQNVALASSGTRPSASGTLPGYDIHKLEHINDGQKGNARSWISNEDGRGWVQLEFAKPERFNRIVWGRDHDGQFSDRLATDYVIEVASDTNHWQVVASSEDRQPLLNSPKPSGPVYYFERFSETEAAEGRRWAGELVELKKEREAVAQTASVYAGIFSQPGPTFRFHRGDAMQPKEEVKPATLNLFRPERWPSDLSERERRQKLAAWIASPENPLTARVIVNRLWQHQFGAGLVDTPNDFGRNGSRPTHPELLDWLASELVHPTNGDGQTLVHPWSLKHIQRIILTSATWRQSSAPRPDALKVDGNSRLLWRFPPRRLEAEAIRDGILMVSGSLDRTAGGASFFLHQVDRENVYHYHPKEEFGPAESRRMVYAFKVRMEQDGIFGSFDCPDGSLVAPKRSVSTTPLQALNLFNSRFMLQQSEAFAARLERESGPKTNAQLQQAWWHAYGRAPSEDELHEASDFVRAEGVPALCRAILNSNEFLFIP